MRVERRPVGTRIVAIRYLLAVCLFILSTVAFVDRTNISIAGVQIGKEFKIDNTHLGWIFSAFLIGYAICQIPAGLLVRQFGPRRVLTWALLWWGVFTAAMAVIPTRIGGAVLLLVLIRLGLGAGEAPMYPAASQFVERWFPVKERGKANGLIFGGVGFGSGVTPPLITAIILHYGWRASFWFSALLGAVAGMVWYLVARDTPEQHPLVDSAELAHIRKGRTTAIETFVAPGLPGNGKGGVPWARIFFSKDILAVTGSYFAFGYVSWIYFAWFYIYLAQVRGLNLKTSAVYSMLPFVAMTVGCLGGGAVSDFIARRYSLRLGRCALAALALAVTAFLLVLGSRTQHAVTASLILSSGAGILYVAQSSYWAVTADFAGEHTGIVSGAMNIGAQAGGACTASLTPLIAAHFGWEMSFLTAAVLALFGAAAWLVVDPARVLVSAPISGPL